MMCYTAQKNLDYLGYTVAQLMVLDRDTRNAINDFREITAL